MRSFTSKNNVKQYNNKVVVNCNFTDCTECKIHGNKDWIKCNLKDRTPDTDEVLKLKIDDVLFHMNNLNLLKQTLINNTSENYPYYVGYNRNELNLMEFNLKSELRELRKEEFSRSRT